MDSVWGLFIVTLPQHHNVLYGDGLPHHDIIGSMKGWPPIMVNTSLRFTLMQETWHRNFDVIDMGDVRIQFILWDFSKFPWIVYVIVELFVWMRYEADGGREGVHEGGYRADFAVFPFKFDRTNGMVVHIGSWGDMASNMFVYGKCNFENLAVIF